MAELTREYLSGCPWCQSCCEYWFDDGDLLHPSRKNGAEAPLLAGECYSEVGSFDFVVDKDIRHSMLVKLLPLVPSSSLAPPSFLVLRCTRVD